MKKFVWIICLFVFGACTENQKELPLPDFKTLIVEAGTFKGFKINSVDALLSRDVQIKVKNAPQLDQVIFEESFLDAGVTKTISYTVTLGEAFPNAVKFTIDKQSINGKNFVGLPFEEFIIEHGYYIIRDTNKNPVNNITFKAQYSGANWLYDLNK